ncbi:hypothetical protein FZC66_00950 [Priestia megaterium]|nr:hypothetical protein FZC66_00950 [Priestia megaterium]
MFAVLLVRLIFVFALAYLLFLGIRYLRNPRRKLINAQEHQQFYVIDEKENIHKNFLLTYKGILFEGEKYLTKNILSITILLKDTDQLNRLTKIDIEAIEKEVQEMYSDALIQWKSPVKEFLQKEPQRN